MCAFYHTRPRRRGFIIKLGIVSDNQGFIILHRKLQDNWLWLSEPFSKSQAWIDLLFLANHKDSSFFLRGIKINVKRGCLARSEIALSERWHWSRDKVRNFLKLLETQQQIIQHKSPIIKVLEILNYNSYQKPDSRPDKKKTIDPTADPTHTINVNNVNNDNEIITVPTKSKKSNIKYDDFQLQVAEQLGEHIKSIKNINLSLGIIKGWANDIRLLQEQDLKPRQDSQEDIINAMQSVLDNSGKEYFPVIESGSSFRKKFTNIENYLRNNKSKYGVKF